MAATKFKKEEKGPIREKITELKLMGWTQSEIAVELKVSQQTISHHCIAIEKGYSERTFANVVTELHRQLDKIALIERKAWAQLHSPESKSQPLSPANCARFMGIVLDCIDRTTKLLGLDRSTQVFETNEENCSDGNLLGLHQHMTGLLASEFKSEPALEVIPNPF